MTSPVHADIRRSALNDVIAKLVAIGIDPNIVQFSAMRETLGVGPAVGTLTAARECLRQLEAIKNETERRAVAHCVNQQFAATFGNTNHGA